MNKFQRFIVACFNVLYPYKVYNKENVPEGAAIFVSNHFRGIDPGFISDVYYKDIYFLAKEELFKNKFIGKLIKSFGGIPINRTNPGLNSIIKATKVLKEGHKLVIFPEGTRNKTGTDELQSIKGGSGVFAVKSKSPILPIILSGKAKIFRRTKIYVGKPFELSDYYGKKLDAKAIEEIDEIIRDKMLEAQAELKSIINKKKKCKS